MSIDVQCRKQHDSLFHRSSCARIGWSLPTFLLANCGMRTNRRRANVHEHVVALIETHILFSKKWFLTLSNTSRTLNAVGRSSTRMSWTAPENLLGTGSAVNDAAASEQI